MEDRKWSEYTWSRKILKREEPELFLIVSKIFDLINEYLLGPHLEN